MPLPLLAAVLRELRTYDWMFPREQRDFESKLAYLRSRDDGERSRLLDPFRLIPVPSELRCANWVDDPEGLVEEFTVALWSMRKVDEYHKAATSFVESCEKNTPETKLPAQRIAIVVVGCGANGGDSDCFESCGLWAYVSPHCRPGASRQPWEVC